MKLNLLFFSFCLVFSSTFAMEKDQQIEKIDKAVALITCPICEKDYKKTEKICVCDPLSHQFHFNCVKPWLKKNDTCPLCKENINKKDFKIEKFLINKWPEKKLKKLLPLTFLHQLPADIYKQLLLLNSDPAMKFWHMQFNLCKPKFLLEHTQRITDVIVQDNTIITACENEYVDSIKGEVKVWNLKDLRKCKQTIAKSASHFYLNSENRLSVITKHKNVHIPQENANAPKLILPKIEGLDSVNFYHFKSYVTTFAHHENTIFLGFTNGDTQIRDLQTMAITFALGREGEVVKLKVDPLNNKLIVCNWCQENNLTIFSLSTNTIDHEITLEKPVIHVELYPEKNIIAAAGRHNIITILNSLTGSIMHTLKDHANFVQSLLVNKKNDTLISGSRDRTIKIWDLEAGKCLNTLSGHSSTIEFLLLDELNNYLISGDQNTIKVWDLTDHRCIQTLKFEDNISCLKFNENPRLLIVGFENANLQLFDLSETEQQNLLSPYMNLPRQFLLKKAYDCWKENKPLILEKDTDLMAAYKQLPYFYKKTLKKIAHVQKK